MKAYCEFCHQDTNVKFNTATQKPICSDCTHTVKLTDMMLKVLRDSKKDIVYFEDNVEKQKHKESLDFFEETIQNNEDTIPNLLDRALKKGIVTEKNKHCYFEERIYTKEAFVKVLEKEPQFCQTIRKLVDE